MQEIAVICVCRITIYIIIVRSIRRNHTQARCAPNVIRERETEGEREREERERAKKRDRQTNRQLAKRQTGSGRPTSRKRNRDTHMD